MNKIKVMIVDDSSLIRSELRKIIEEDSQLKVVYTTRDGVGILKKIKIFKPDVITLDIQMPYINGLQVLEEIMQYSPMPVIMVSSLTAEGTEETLDALSIGAFDFIQKPSSSIKIGSSLQKSIIHEKIKTAFESSKKYSKNTLPEKSIKNDIKIRSLPTHKNIHKIIGIGVSTGGPKTLNYILPQIPKEFPGSILVAQHMPPKFTLSFANRLNKICKMEVKEGIHGEALQKGCIYIAPGGYHMKIVHKSSGKYVIQIIENISDALYKPSVNVLFQSLNEIFHKNWIGILLTGMGDDGASTLGQLREYGGHTIVESEESCVVYGMPYKAVQYGAAEYILDKHEIAKKMMYLSEVT